MANAVSEDMLPSVGLEEPFVVECRDAVRGILQKNLIAPRKLIEDFREYNELAELDEGSFIDAWKKGLEATDEEIKKLLLVNISDFNYGGITTSCYIIGKVI